MPNDKLLSTEPKTPRHRGQGEVKVEKFFAGKLEILRCRNMGDYTVGTAAKAVVLPHWVVMAVR